MFFPNPAMGRELFVVRDVLNGNPNFQLQVTGTNPAVVKVRVTRRPEFNYVANLFLLPDRLGDTVLDPFRDGLVLRTTGTN